MFVILLGLPGAGKGTQAAYVSQKTGLAHITTGELFRDNVRRGTDLGVKAKPYVESGKLVPDELTIGMLLERISSPDCSRGFLLDGFPRNLEQARALDDALARRGATPGRVLYIKVSTDELIARLSGRWNCPQCAAVYHERNLPPRRGGVCDKCGGRLQQREDDRPDVVRTRLEVNLAQMEGLIDYYRQQGKLVEIDGEGEVEAVGRSMLAALGVSEEARL